MPKPSSLADFLHGWSYDERPVYTHAFTQGFRNKYFDRIEKEGKKTLREDLLKADRFVLSNDFLRRCIMRASDSNIAHMLANADLARLPTTNVLVEWDDSVRFEMHEHLGTAPTKAPENEDWARAGFLYLPLAKNRGGSGRTGWQAIHVSSSPGSLPVWPASSILRDPATSADPLDDLKDSDLLNQFFAATWGLRPPGGGLGFAMHKELLQRGFTSLDPYFAFPFSGVFKAARNDGHDEPMSAFMRAMMRYARENCGSIRLATVILASLNTVPTRIVHTVPQGKFQYRFRNLPQFDQRTVFIDAKPGHEVHVYDRAMHEATGRHNRRHEVRGHWRDVSRSGVPTICQHEPADTDGGYALCGKCTRLLRWIEHHERGDEKLGWVFHDHYTVA